MKRDFKGIWIPKEIWLSEDLTMQEKLFFVEIDSLDNEDHCFASNGYFADFFDLSKGRCSQIIASLKEKGYIDISYKRDGKKVQKRVIKILKGGIKYPKGGIKYPKGGIKNPKGGYLENDKGNNTSNNNTSNNREHSPEKYELPTKKQVIEYFSNSDMMDVDVVLEAEKFINHYSDMNWRKNKGKGDRIDNWHRQAGTWIANYKQYNSKRLQQQKSEKIDFGI